MERKTWVKSSKKLYIIKETMPKSSDDSAAATITPGPVPTAAVTDPNARGCLQADNIYSSCAAQTSGFDGNNYSNQASCLCYWTSSGMVGWQPQTYDALMDSCYNYINTQSGQVTAASDLWSQLSLKASRIEPSPTPHQSGRSFDAAFALTHLDCLVSLPTKLECPFGTVANVQDIKPPTSIPVGFLNFIELQFTLLPLPLHGILPKTPSGQAQKHKGYRRSSRLGTQCHRPKRVLVVKLRENLALAKDNDDLDDDTLFRSSELESDTKMLDNDEDGQNGLRFSKWEDQILAHEASSKPATDDEASARDITPTPQPPEPNLANFFRLIDASFRHTISGTRSTDRRINKVINIPDITLAKATPNPSLADISPSIFRPGYMKRLVIDDEHRIQAIADRAPLISRIASSISNICSRSRKLSQPRQNDDLQPKLWYLLQRRKWPTQDLEPVVSCDDLLALTNHACARRATLFDSDQESDRAGVVKEVEKEEDKDMLDLFSGMMEDEDDDLFLSYETTPLFSSSQERGADEVMLEDDEGRGVEEEMLLEGDGCTSLQFARAQYPQLEGMVIDSSRGMEEGIEDGGSGMLF
ncbi:MAG: hypothetical protein Q9181_001485 [Wetmoreana brouardii]